jgi:methyl-accepting chemotaxis protein
MSMNNWTIRQRINLGFASITIIAVAFGVFAIARFSLIKADTTHIVQENLPAMDRAGNLAEQFQALGDNSSVLFMKEIMSPTDDLRAGFADQIQTNLLNIGRLAVDYSSRVQDPDEKKLFAGFRTALDSYKEVFDHGIQLCSAGKPQEAMELKENELEPALVKLMACVHQLEDFNKTNGEAAGARILAAVNNAQKGVWAGVIFLLLAAGAVSLVIIFTTTNILNRFAVSLNEAADKMTQAGAQVAGSSQSVAQNAGEQAASIQAVSTSLGQMIEVTSNNANQARLATGIAQQTHATAAAGTKTMAELDTAVQEINAASGDIAKIVRTIDEIAFQTNILALNAAVEAARAGEAGMGFAVVAGEVRNLAQRSAQAAKETASRIESTIAKAAKGAELSKRLKNNFAEIFSQAGEMDKVDQQLADLAREQADGITRISSGVSQLDKVTQSNATNAEESAHAAEELNGQAKMLKGNVAELLQLVGSRKTAGPQAFNVHPAFARNGKHFAPDAETVLT